MNSGAITQLDIIDEQIRIKTREIKLLEREYLNVAVSLMQAKNENESVATTPATLVCKKCNIEKPMDEYYFYNGYYRKSCKACEIKSKVEYQKRRRENYETVSLREQEKEFKKMLKKKPAPSDKDFGKCDVEELAIRATQNNMSYGKMVALKYMERMKNEAQKTEN